LTELKKLLARFSSQEKEILSLKTEITKLKNDLSSEATSGYPVDEILTLMPGNIFWKDITGKLLGCNNNNANFFGFSSPEKMIGLYTKDLVPEENLAKQIDENDQEIMVSGRGKFFEESGLDINKQPAVFFTQKIPLYDALGKVKGLLGIAIDITERKKIEMELKLAKEKAEASSQAKLQFLAIINHELRTPLTSIIGLIDFLKQENLTKPEEKNIIEDLENCALYLLALVNDILDFSKLEANKMYLNICPINLYDLVNEVVRILERLANNKGLTLRVNFDKKIPKIILTDAKIIRQILVNIIGNAIKFTEQGFVEVKINLIKKNQRAAILEIVVSDTGCGIPADKVDVIFEPFQQLENTYIRQSSRSGTGLGLAVVKKLVELLKMTIKVSSEESKGSIFTLQGEFEISKLKERRITHREICQISANQIEYIDSQIKPKVLVVEDDLIVQRIHKNMLTKLGCQVDVATYGLQAIEMVSDHHILFVDIGLSDITGFEVIKSIRKNKSLPIIALTGYTTEEERKKCMEAGANQVVDKPVSIDGLQEILSKYMRL
jgi:two-component system, OmpR family, aerobic respiration control sensor histidine kinase ArcB